MNPEERVWGWLIKGTEGLIRLLGDFTRGKDPLPAGVLQQLQKLHEALARVISREREKQR